MPFMLIVGFNIRHKPMKARVDRALTPAPGTIMPKGRHLGFHSRDASFIVMFLECGFRARVREYV